MFITLPLTAKTAAPIGYWLTPVLVDALSRQSGERGIIFYNKLGKKTPDELVERMFLKKLDFFGVTAEASPDSSFKEELLCLCDEALSNFSVKPRIQSCYKCPCGCLELPVSIASFAKPKTFMRVGGAYICKVCGEAGLITDASSGFMDLQNQDLVEVGLYPRLYQGEVRDLVQQLGIQGIPVFKTRETGCVLRGKNVDVEFVWSQLILLLSRKYPSERIRLVVTNHILRQAVVSLALAKSLNESLKADLVVLPCIDHPGKIEKWDTKRLEGIGYTSELMRLMLVGSLGWNQKNASLFEIPSTVEYRRMTLFKHLVGSAGVGVEAYPLAKSMSNLSQTNLVLGLKYVFGSKPFDYCTLKGVL